MSIIIKRRVYLEPMFLDQNIEKHLLSKIVESTNNECSKEYGHFLSINKIRMYENTEDTIFLVEFEANTFKPTVGDEVSGKVFMVYKDGIFININGKQKMLVPSTTMKTFKFESIRNIYSYNKETIQEGDEVVAKITAVKYTKNGFSCCGCLV